MSEETDGVGVQKAAARCTKRGQQAGGVEGEGRSWSAIGRSSQPRNAPSISTLLPIVRFHCFPARAMRLSRRSPSMLFAPLRPVGPVRVVAFAARSVASVAPEKNAWML